MKATVLIARHFLPLLILTAAPLFAQAPSADWRTLSTPHFRFHYPIEYEEWTMRAAARIESVRDAVVKEVGYAPDDVTEVLVMNPAADANGITLPILGHPRIVLYAEPPDPESAIGEFGEWIDLLTVHETTHLIHLIRPSRSPIGRLIEQVLPFNAITRSAPRWVMEGYATVVEGRVTGTGRPSSSIRAAILRKWAIHGRLPSYSQLDADSRFAGMSMAYLAGSAFLEWLELRNGPESLRHLWARLTARQRRNFDSAFEGVFGESAERLYGIFTAELTQKAVDLQRLAPAVEGELWQETKRGTGEPAVSPDGKQIALVERDEHHEAKLVVFSTGENEEEKKLEERIAKNLKRDPQDVAPVRTKPLARKPVYTLRLVDPDDISSPRWTRDGNAIVYSHHQPDRDGFLHHDLFIWRPSSNENRRITRLADIRDADPMPDGKHAIAVRTRFGWSQIVKIDLSSGAVVEELTQKSIDRVVTHPRVSAGGRVAWTEHDGSGWHIVVDGTRRADGFGPEWGADGALFSVVASGGFIDIHRNGEAITAASGAAIQPAPAPDGSVYFMALEPDGFVVRRVAPASSRPTPLARAGVDNNTYVPAVPPKPSTPAALREGPVSSSHTYGIGRQERGYMFGGSWTAYDSTHELGLRLGDIVGRLDSIAMIASGDDQGGAIASTWRGWPVAVTAHAYKLRNRRGLELRGEYEHHAPSYVMNLEAGTASRAFGIGSLMLRQRKTSETIRIALDSDKHSRGSLRLATKAGDDIVFSLTGEAARHSTVGGFASSIVPDAILVERVLDPALPAAYAFAKSYRGLRLDAGSDGFSIFWQRHDIDGRKIDVRGIELAMSASPMPLLRSAGFTLTLGAAKVSSEKGVKGWVGLRWRP